MAKSSLDARIKDSVGKTSHPSMVPDWNPPAPPPKEEEIVPDIRELVPNPLDRNRLANLIRTSAEFGKMEKEAKTARTPVTAAIKTLLSKYQIGRAVCDGVLINYYNAPRASLSRELLLSSGVSPKTLDACTITKDSFTLRISATGEDDD